MKISNLNNLEKKYGKLDCWKAIKFSIYNKLAAEYRGGNLAKKTINIRTVIIIIYTCIYASIFPIVNCFKKRKVIIFGASTRLRKNGDKLIPQKLFDLSWKFYHISNDDMEAVKAIIFNRVFPENIFRDILLFILRWLLPSSLEKLYTKEEYRQIKDLQNDVSLLLDGVSVEKLALQFHLEKKVYSFLLRILKPKKIYIISGYSKSPIIVSAREKKIKVIELQHGLIYPFHPMYKVNHDYRELIHEPDLLCVRSTFWKGLYQQNNTYEFPVSVLPSLDEKINPWRSDNEINYIIFTSQDELFDFTTPFLRDLAERLSEIKIMLYYRPHPRESITKARGMFKSSSNILVIDKNQCSSTRSLIKGSRLHLSMYSACHVDALEIKGETYVIGKLNEFLFPLDAMDRLFGKSFNHNCSVEDIFKAALNRRVSNPDGD